MPLAAPSIPHPAQSDDASHHSAAVAGRDAIDVEATRRGRVRSIQWYCSRRTVLRLINIVRGPLPSHGVVQKKDRSKL